MLKQIIVAENPFEPDTWESFHTSDILAFLKERYETFPDTARIYQGQVSVDNDVTPSDEAGIERLANMDGPFYLVVYPGDPDYDRNCSRRSCGGCGGLFVAATRADLAKHAKRIAKQRACSTRKPAQGKRTYPGYFRHGAIDPGLIGGPI